MFHGAVHLCVWDKECASVGCRGPDVQTGGDPGAALFLWPLWRERVGGRGIEEKRKRERENDRQRGRESRDR